METAALIAPNVPSSSIHCSLLLLSLSAFIFLSPPCLAHYVRLVNVGSLKGPCNRRKGLKVNRLIIFVKSHVYFCHVCIAELFFQGVASSNVPSGATVYKESVRIKLHCSSLVYSWNYAGHHCKPYSVCTQFWCVPLFHTLVVPAVLCNVRP